MQLCPLLLTPWQYRHAEPGSAGCALWCASPVEGCERYRTVGGNCLGSSHWVPVMVQRVIHLQRQPLPAWSPTWTPQPVMGCLIFCGAFEPLFSTTTKGPWLWWASSQVPPSRRLKNIFSIEWLNTPGASVALNIELLLTTCFRYLGNETSSPQQLALRKEMKYNISNRFRWWSYSFKRKINHSKWYMKTKGRKTHRQGVEERQPLASLAQPHDSQLISLHAEQGDGKVESQTVEGRKGHLLSHWSVRQRCWTLCQRHQDAEKALCAAVLICWFASQWNQNGNTSEKVDSLMSKTFGK